MRVTAARLAAAVLVIFGLAGAAWWYLRTPHGAWVPALHHRELATRTLAENLAKTNPKVRALALANPFSRRPGQDPEVYAFERAGLDGLKAGFHAPATLAMAYPDLRPEFAANPQSIYVDPKTSTPLSYLVATNAFIDLARQHADCDLMVSLIGLPVGVGDSEWWRAEKPRLALLLPDWRLLGGPEAVRAAFQSGKIAAAILNRPGAPAEEAPELSDPVLEFERRYLLVTPQNFEKLFQAHPKLF